MRQNVLNRRQWLARVGAGLGASYGRTRAQSDEATSSTLVGGWLEPFVDPLPVPRVLQPRFKRSGVEHYQLVLGEFRQKLHRDLPPTIVWGFNGVSPGPTIEAKRDCSVVVDWVNRLPLRHRLLVDHSLDGAGTDVPEVRTTIHLHGGRNRQEDDGYPDTWITPGHQQTTHYRNHQPAATLWYHDHSMAITRLNAAMGLAGTYILRDPAEETLGLPSGAFDVPLVLQDRVLDARGQLVYAVGANQRSVWMPEFLGSHILVNGRVAPYFNVHPAAYRFRLVNASNARVFQLALDPGQEFVHIGTDNALLSDLVSAEELLLSPGERLDVLIDFRGRQGRRINLINFAPAPYPSGSGLVPPSVLQFRVGSAYEVTPPRNDYPSRLGSLPPLSTFRSTRTRQLTMVEAMSNGHESHRMLLNGARFMDPATEIAKRGTVETWELVNLTADAHPIHLHAVHFRILGRQRFDVRHNLLTSELKLIGNNISPAAEERGWKDTVLCPPGQVTRIVVPFDGEPGRFVWHCHILEHEDNEMMRPLIIEG